jgi:hypothetical protein
MHQSSAQTIETDEIELHMSAALDVKTNQVSAHETGLGLVGGLLAGVMFLLGRMLFERNS